MDKHLPGADRDDLDTMALALHLEQRFWDNMTTAIANGIAMAFNGD